MKTKAIGSFFVLFAIAAGVVAMTPAAFADHPEVTIVPAEGSASPGCEEAEEGCYIPKVATVDVGGVVVFSNTDSAAHTWTAGSLEDGPTGEFDTGLLMVDNSFEWKAETAGEIPYFCMVHPWMTGVIVVQEAGAADDHEKDDAKHPTGEMHEIQEDTVLYGMTSDGTVRVEIATGTPTAGDSLKINVNFIDPEKSDSDEAVLVEHINYDITATQDGIPVLFDEKNYEPAGGGEHFTSELNSDSPVDIKVTLLGIGENKPFWGPTGEVVMFHVVPEFGIMAMMVLAVAIISIVAISTRSRLGIAIPRY